MTPSARIQATIDILERLGIENRPADALVSAYFRTRRFIGSKDRSEVAARVYAVLRHHARLGWWLAKVEAEDTPRNRVIAELTLAEDVAVKDMGRLFSGETYAPIPLDGPEDKLVKATAGQPLDHPDMPKPVRSEIPDWASPSLEAMFGDRFEVEVNALLACHPFVIIPSAVSSHSWNVIFTAAAATGAYELRSQERFALDTRLHPPAR